MVMVVKHLLDLYDVPHHLQNLQDAGRASRAQQPGWVSRHTLSPGAIATPIVLLR